MDNTTQTMDRLLDYEVVDAEGNKVGPVEHMWVDGATGRPEFLAVKSGSFLGSTHIVPVAGARIDEGRRQMRLPYRDDQIKNAPHFDKDAELSDDDERRVYDYYGLERSTAPSPSGLAAGAGMRREAPEMRTSGQDQQTIPLAEEELEVGKRPVEAGRVRLRKVIRTEHVSQPVELRREEVHVERVPASGEQVPPNAFQEQEIEVPVRREEPVVEKEAHLTGQVRVGKTAETERRTVEGDVRREDVELDREGNVETRRMPPDRR